MQHITIHGIEYKTVFEVASRLEALALSDQMYGESDGRVTERRMIFATLRDLTGSSSAVLKLLANARLLSTMNAPLLTLEEEILVVADENHREAATAAMLIAREAAKAEGWYPTGDVEPAPVYTDTLTATAAVHEAEAALWAEYNAICDKIAASDPFAAFNAMSRTDLEEYIESEIEGESIAAAPSRADLLTKAQFLREAAEASIQYEAGVYIDLADATLSEITIAKVVTK